MGMTDIPGPLSHGACDIRGPPCIFVVEDNPGVSEAVRDSLREMGFLISGWQQSAEEALPEIGRLHPDLVLMDISLAGEMDGIAAAEYILNTYSIPVVFLTGSDDEDQIIRITESGSYGFLAKPYNDIELRLTIHIAIYKHRIDACIRQSEQFYRTLAEAIDDGIILIDKKGETRYMNGAARNLITTLSGLDPDSLIGCPLSQNYPGFLQEEILLMMDLLNSDPGHGRKVSTFQAPGLGIWIELSILPVSDHTALTNGHLIILRDVSLRMEYELEVQKAGLSRIEENMEKFQILNDQIRNPLQVLLGLVDLDDSPFKSRYMDQIYEVDQVIRDFDEAWFRSEKVRRFLLSHYGHGMFLSK